MLAVDTSVLIPFIEIREGPDIERFRKAICGRNLYIPPPVLAEILSDPRFPYSKRQDVREYPLMPLLDGFWERAGLTRAELISRGLRPKLPDTLIAQCCLDHDAALLTRDAGFKPFVEHCGLKLCEDD